GQDPDPVHALRRRLDGKRHGEESTADEAREGSTVSHWITSSARACTDGEMVRPSGLAVFRLMVKLNFTGCSLISHFDAPVLVGPLHRTVIRRLKPAEPTRSGDPGRSGPGQLAC